MSPQPTTLGDKLGHFGSDTPGGHLSTALRKAGYSTLNFVVVAAILALLFWWQSMRPEFDRDFLLGLLAALTACWLFVHYRRRAVGPHFLLANDRKGFMRGLRLDAKTAIIDGSNIYHFGRSNKLDAQPLGEIVHQLRTGGFRVICFFDSNIFFTLNDHNAFPESQRHSLTLLEDIFGLMADEIYVVPSGVQADKYVLECLRHLPISFAVTNDQFRDYAKEYAEVMKDSLWRKGVELSDGQTRLRNFNFKTP